MPEMPLSRMARGAVRSAVLLLIFAGAVLSRGASQTRTLSFHLKPRQPQTLAVPLAADQVAVIHLHLHGGIIGIRETAPDASGRPLWLIDLGRGAELSYVSGGSSAGDYILEITSFEKAKLADVSLEVGDAAPVTPALKDLRQAEDLLANADLIRRHWPTAPAGLDAVQLYDRALALAVGIGDTPLQRLILTQKARHLMVRQGKFTDADALLQQALALPQANDLPQQALAFKTLSSVRYDLGQYQPAIKAGLSALDLYQQTGDLYWRGIVLGNLSSVYWEIGQSADALAAAQEALKDAQAEHDTAGVVYCLSQLAGLYQQQGDLENALRTFHEGLAWVADIGYAPLVEAEIQNDLGAFYTQIGNWEQASLALQRCIELERSQDDPVSLAARGMLASVMQHQRRLLDAVAQDTAAIEIAAKLALKQNQAELLIKRASVQLALHRQSAAEADVDAAEKLTADLASRPLKIEVAIAKGEAQLGTDIKAAADSYRKAIQLAQEDGEQEAQSVAQAGLARALQLNARFEDAAAAIEAALKTVETSRESFASRELQTSYFSMHRGWYEQAVDICMELDRRHPGKGYAQMAFAYTERARARSLLDSLDSSGYRAAIPVSEELRESFALNQRAVVAQQAHLANSHEHNQVEIAKKLQQLYQEQEGLESRMSSGDARFASMLGNQTVDADQVQRELLDGHSILLSYWIGEHHSFRWSITSSGLSVDALPPRATLEKIILPLESMLQSRRPLPVSGDDISLYASRQRAYEHHLDLALTQAGSLLLSHISGAARKVFIVGDGCLQTLPFAALRVSNGKLTSYALRRFGIYLESSASVVMYLKQHPAAGKSPNMAIFADPVFSPSDSRLAGIDTERTNLHSLFSNMERLNGSAAEARKIAEDLPGAVATLRTGFDASPEQVRNLASTNTSILHFATHTVTIAGHPEITGIALSMWNREGKQQDGVFWLKDIYSLRLPLSLVVLSGCRTNGQEVDQGEGLNNLAYAFFFAGAHAVVGSLWSVDDSDTSRLMQTFYRELLIRHRSTDEAMRQAQLEMLSNPRTSSPAAWASFVLEGWPAQFSSNSQSPATASLPLSQAMKGK